MNNNLDFSTLGPPPTAKPLLHAGHYGWFAAAVLALTVYGSLVPFQFRPQPFDQALAAFRDISVWAVNDLGARGDWSLTVTLFAALGFLLMGMLSVDQRATVGLRAAGPVIATGAALSALIEFAQVYFPPRTVSVNDLVLQAAGVALGTLTWLVVGQRMTKWARRLCSATGVAGLAHRLWPGYLAVLVLVQLMPFDFTVSVDELAAKYRDGRISLVPFALLLGKGAPEWIGKLFIHGLCFAPLGFLRVLAMDPASPLRRSWPLAVIFGLVSATLVEALQLLVYTRVCDTTDILIGTTAVALGWYAGRRFIDFWDESLAEPELPLRPNWHPAIWAALTLGWLAAVLYFNWTPFDFTANPASFRGDPEGLTQYGLRRFSLLPVVDYYWGSKYNALDQFLKKTLSFLPLGVLLALAAGKLHQRGARRRLLLVALPAAVLLEAGSYFLPSRLPSSTDVLISCFGAWLGYTLTQHIRVVFWAERALFGFMHQYARGPHQPHLWAGSASQSGR